MERLSIALEELVRRLLVAVAYAADHRLPVFLVVDHSLRPGGFARFWEASLNSATS
jgi:hypothetical protein